MPATKGSPTPPDPQGRSEHVPAAPAAAVPPKEREKARVKEQREKRVRAQKQDNGIPEPSPRWWAPTMVTLMLIGLVWVVVYYVSSGALPIKAIHVWNLLVGFAFMLVGFLMTTRWR